MTPFSFVSCVWKDAWADAVEGTTAKDAGDKHRPTLMETMGWLLYEDVEGVSIFNERCLDKGEEYYRGRSYILKVNIQSIIPVKISKPRKARVKKVSAVIAPDSPA